MLILLKNANLDIGYLFMLGVGISLGFHLGFAAITAFWEEN